MTPLETLYYWVTERENVRLRKEMGDPFPWTDDPILRDWRFCCVRREDDRVTRWVADHIRRRFAGHPNLWFMLCAARAINWPGTLSQLMGCPSADPEDRYYPGAWPDSDLFSPDDMGAALEDIASAGIKVFTGAYVITAPQKKGAKKTTFVARETLGNLWKHRAEFAHHFGHGPTLRSTHALLMAHPGWGPFMAYQAVVDMRFTPLLMLASDVETWCAAGPGTIRGLNRINGRHVCASVTQEHARSQIVALWRTIPKRTGVDLDLSDVPNVLCEVDKYLRVKNGEGEPRARYVPGRGS